MLAVAVPTHEELSDELNQMYTVYNVEVEREVGGKLIAWHMRKRYSAFADLYGNLCGSYVKELEGYQFPNKSMFNTYATFTKDRRKAGFEEMLKILVKIDPLPLALEDFLEIDDHIHDNQLPTFLTRATDEKTKTRRIKPVRLRKKTESEAKSAEAEARGSFSRTDSMGGGSGAQENGEVSGANSAASEVSAFSLDSLRQMAVYYGKVFLVVLVLYTACVLSGVIDVASTTWGEFACSISFCMIGCVLTRNFIACGMYCRPDASYRAITSVDSELHYLGREKALWRVE